MYLRSALLFFFALTILACGSNTSDRVHGDLDPHREVATDVKMFYTDSAITQFRLIAPVRESYLEDKKLIEDYPKGVDIEFYDNDGNITSSMVAKSATRIGVDGLMTMKDSVVMYNARGDALKTTGILWDENHQTLKTAKFVQLIQADSRDTMYGFGFEAADDFSRFQIIQLTGKRQFEDITEDVSDNP